MVSVTISVSEEVRELMRRFPEVNWSGLVRSCITEKAKRLALRSQMLKELNKERGFNDWAVKIIREGRKV